MGKNWKYIYNVINNVCTFTVLSMAKIYILGFILFTCSVGPKQSPIVSQLHFMWTSVHYVPLLQKSEPISIDMCTVSITFRYSDIRARSICKQMFQVFFKNKELFNYWRLQIISINIYCLKYIIFLEQVHIERQGRIIIQTDLKAEITWRDATADRRRPHKNGMGSAIAKNLVLLQQGGRW